MSLGLDVFLDVIQILFLWNAYNVNFHLQLAEFFGCFLNCQPLLIYFVLKFRLFNFFFLRSILKSHTFQREVALPFPTPYLQGPKAAWPPAIRRERLHCGGILDLWNCLVSPCLIRFNCNVGNMPSHWISGAWVLEMLLCGGLSSAAVKGTETPAHHHTLFLKPESLYDFITRSANRNVIWLPWKCRNLHECTVK